MKPTTKLHEVIADLVDSEWAVTFLNRLFSFHQGNWITLKVIVSGMSDVEKELEKIYEKEPKLKWVDVVWLRYPPYEADGDEFALILFFCESIRWSDIVICNKSYHEEKSRQS